LATVLTINWFTFPHHCLENQKNTEITWFLFICHIKTGFTVWLVGR